MIALLQLKKIRPPSLKERAKERTRKWRTKMKERKKILFMGDSNTEGVIELIEEMLGRKVDSVAEAGSTIKDITAQADKIKTYRKVIVILGANNPSLMGTADAHSQFFRKVGKLTSDPRRRMKLFATIIPKACANEKIVAEKDSKNILVTTFMRRKTIQATILLHGAVPIQPPLTLDSYEGGLHVNKIFGAEIVRMLCKAGVLDGA